MIDLPEYLEKIRIVKSDPPSSPGTIDLPFHQLDPAVFERFCCELLISKSESEQREKVVQIIPIGRPGQRQFGSDIFSVDRSSELPVYNLYEVKRVKNFNKRNFEETVKRFIENYNKWGFKINEFCIFVSQKIDGKEIALWQSEAKKLSSLDVTYCSGQVNLATV